MVNHWFSHPDPTSCDERPIKDASPAFRNRNSNLNGAFASLFPSWRLEIRVVRIAFVECYLAFQDGRLTLTFSSCSQITPTANRTLFTIWSKATKMRRAGFCVHVSMTTTRALVKPVRSAFNWCRLSFQQVLHCFRLIIHSRALLSTRRSSSSNKLFLHSFSTL